MIKINLPQSWQNNTKEIGVKSAFFRHVLHSCFP
jgi:hypothetical protein